MFAAYTFRPKQNPDSRQHHRPIKQLHEREQEERQFRRTQQLLQLRQRPLQDVIEQTMKTLNKYNLTTTAVFNHEVCTAYDLTNYICFDNLLPPSCDIVRWSNWHTDCYSGRTFGSVLHKQLFHIIVNLEVTDPQELFEMTLHEIGHAHNIVTGTPGRPHGKQFHQVIVKMLETVKSYLQHYERIFGTQLTLDRKHIQRTRFPRQTVF